MSAPTTPIPLQDSRRPRRRHPIRALLIVLLVLVVLVAVALVVGERIFRSSAEQRIEQSVDASLPTTVRGHMTAEIRGFSALQQWSKGSFDDVVLRSSDLKVNGAPASARFDVHGLPVDGTGTLPEATGTLTVGQAAFRSLPALQQAHASAPVLRPGRVTTSLKQTYLGIPVDVDVTLTPALHGKYIRLSPTSATVRSGVVSLPATAIVQQLLPNGVSVCTAASLPRGVQLTSVSIGSGKATATLVAKRLSLADLRSGRTGSCS